MIFFEAAGAENAKTARDGVDAFCVEYWKVSAALRGRDEAAFFGDICRRSSPGQLWQEVVQVRRSGVFHWIQQ